MLLGGDNHALARDVTSSCRRSRSALSSSSQLRRRPHTACFGLTRQPSSWSHLRSRIPPPRWSSCQNRRPGVCFNVLITCGVEAPFSMVQEALQVPTASWTSVTFTSSGAPTFGVGAVLPPFLCTNVSSSMFVLSLCHPTSSVIGRVLCPSFVKAGFPRRPALSRINAFRGVLLVREWCYRSATVTCVAGHSGQKGGQHLHKKHDNQNGSCATT